MTIYLSQWITAIAVLKLTMNACNCSSQIDKRTINKIIQTKITLTIVLQNKHTPTHPPTNTHTNTHTHTHTHTHTQAAAIAIFKISTLIFFNQT